MPLNTFKGTRGLHCIVFGAQVRQPNPLRRVSNPVRARRAVSVPAVHRSFFPMRPPNIHKHKSLGCSLDSSLCVSQRNIPYRLELDASVVSAGHQDGSPSFNVGKAVERRVRAFHEVAVCIGARKSAVRSTTPIIAFSAACDHVALLRKRSGRSLSPVLRGRCAVSVDNDSSQEQKTDREKQQVGDHNQRMDYPLSKKNSISGDVNSTAMAPKCLSFGWSYH